MRLQKVSEDTALPTDERDKIEQSAQQLETLANMLINGTESNNEMIEQIHDEQDREFVAQNFRAPADNLTCNVRLAPTYARVNTQAVNQRFDNLHIIEALQFDQIKTVLSKLGQDWNFDMFFITKCTSKPLEVTGLYLVERYDLDRKYGGDTEDLKNFLRKLETNYKADNPYHNATHAADVANSLFFFIEKTKLNGCTSDLEIFGCIIAALAHDVGHPGFNNRFLVNSKDPLAIKYNDASVLENMHAAFVYELFQNDSKAMLSLMDDETWVLLRRIVVEMILFTDMSKHFNAIGHFKTKYCSTKDESLLSNFEDRLEVLKVGMKCADIGHTAKTYSLHEKWSLKIVEEFFNQGDQEKILGLPISMYCDRETTNVAKSQEGFLANIGIPLFEAFNMYLESFEVDEQCV